MTTRLRASLMRVDSQNWASIKGRYYPSTDALALIKTKLKKLILFTNK